MYYTFLLLHSWNRWLVLISGVLTICFSIQGIIAKRDYQKIDNAWSLLFIGSIHLQAVLGLSLYLFLSPIVKTAFSNLGEIMTVRTYRYWGIEHITGMVLAIVIAQIGRIKSKKGSSDKEKFSKALTYYCIAFLIILGTVIVAYRPWIRF